MIKKAAFTATKASSDLMLNIIARCFSKNRALLLAAVTEYCLQKLDNKCFKLQQDLLEDYLANHART